MSGAPSDAELAKLVKREARLIDEKRFGEWYELFSEDAFYWVPAAPRQADPLLHNSLAYEDKLLLRIRVERLKSDRAYSLHPESRSLHVLQEPEVERRDDSRKEYLLRTPFLYTETRGDESQRYAATAWHTLVLLDNELKIRLKRVDILNCDAALPSIQLFL